MSVAGALNQIVELRNELETELGHLRQVMRGLIGDEYQMPQDVGTGSTLVESLANLIDTIDDGGNFANRDFTNLTEGTAPTYYDGAFARSAKVTKRLYLNIGGPNTPTSVTNRATGLILNRNGLPYDATDPSIGINYNSSFSTGELINPPFVTNRKYTLAIVMSDRTVSSVYSVFLLWATNQGASHIPGHANQPLAGWNRVGTVYGGTPATTNINPRFRIAGSGASYDTTNDDRLILENLSNSTTLTNYLVTLIET